jgi:hypothetical protein
MAKDKPEIDWKEQERVASEWQKKATETAKKTGLSGNKPKGK